MVFRGVGLNDAALKASLLTKRALFYFDRAFASMSTSESVARGFCEINSDSEMALLLTNTYSGKSLDWIFAHVEEAELLPPAGTRFMIWKRRKTTVTVTTKDGPQTRTLWLIHLLEIRQDLDMFVRVWGRGELLYSSLLAAERAGGD